MVDTSPDPDVLDEPDEPDIPGMPAMSLSLGAAPAATLAAAVTFSVATMPRSLWPATAQKSW